MARYIYLRVSTDRQNFAQQLEDIKNYGVDPETVDGIVEEHESGGKSYTDRKFKQLLNQCNPGDTIYAGSTDRLGRNFVDMIRLMNEAKELGITVVACKQNIRLDSDDVGTKILLTVTAILDEDERNRIRHRIANKKAWQREQIAQQGYFIVERGENVGNKCRYVGRPKVKDMSEAQLKSWVAIQESAYRTKTDKAIRWREQSRAVAFSRRKQAEGWTVTQIADELGKLYDENAAATVNPYATPRGFKPSVGTVSMWLRSANPIAL